MENSNLGRMLLPVFHFLPAVIWSAAVSRTLDTPPPTQFRFLLSDVTQRLVVCASFRPVLWPLSYEIGVVLSAAAATSSADRNCSCYSSFFFAFPFLLLNLWHTSFFLPPLGMYDYTAVHLCYCLYLSVSLYNLSFCLSVCMYVCMYVCMTLSVYYPGLVRCLCLWQSVT